LTPQQFVDKWRNVQLKKRSAAQEHFIDVCGLVGQPRPAEYDPAGARFSFEKGASKNSGEAAAVLITAFILAQQLG
jgi:hypothetical protein